MKELDIKIFLDSMDKDFILIDTRSPEEFDQSHIIGSINLYSLNNKEREEVGTLYKQSPFKAKMLGASLICKNISFHLQNKLANITPKTKIFLYCSRGGLRSGSFGTVLSNIGFRVYKLKNGYKAYRNYVLDYLDTFEYDNFLVLDGLTGSGKSEIIREFENKIDLEKLANHYGSSFGQINGEQPSTKQFQNSIFHQLRKMEKYKYILIEGESKKIGKLHVPHRLHQKMLKAPRIWIEASLKDRVQRIIKDYKNIDEVFFETAIEKIRPYIEKKYLNEIITSFYQKDLQKCASILLEKYYDKVYKHRGDHIVSIYNDSLQYSKEKIKNFISSLN